MKLLSDLLVFACLSTAVLGQAVVPLRISDSCLGATVSYQHSTFDNSPTGTAGFTGNGTGDFGVDTGCDTDTMFGHDAYWRLSTDPTNSVFYDARLAGDQGGVTSQVTASSFTVNWGDVANRGVIGASWVATAVCCGVRCGRVDHAWTLTNSDGANPIDVEFYAYADLDLLDLSTNTTDSVSSANRHVIRQANCVDECLEFWADGANSYEIDTWPFLADKLNSLITPFTGLSNAGLPYGPNDYTGAMGWQVSIPAGGQVTFHYTIGMNCSRCANAAGVASVGSGTSALTTTSTGAHGCPIEVAVIGASPNVLGALFLGLVLTPVSFSLVFPNCTNEVFQVATPLGHATATADAQGAIAIEALGSCDPAFCGTTLFFQYVQLDPTALCPVTVSNAIGVTFGT